MTIQEIVTMSIDTEDPRSCKIILYPNGSHHLVMPEGFEHVAEDAPAPEHVVVASLAAMVCLSKGLQAIVSQVAFSHLEDRPCDEDDHQAMRDINLHYCFNCGEKLLD